MQAIYKPDAALPRGPHRLDRETVLASQRGRLLFAMAGEVADVGYGETAVAAVAARASVSLRTFYEQFDGKQECFLAAYDVGVEILLAETQAVFDPSKPWREAAADVVRRFLEVLAAEPSFARTFLVEIGAAGAAGRRRRTEVLDRFAAFHVTLSRLARSQEPGLAELDAPLRVALVAGIDDLVAREVAGHGVAGLAALEPALVRLIVAVYEGAPA